MNLRKITSIGLAAVLQVLPLTRVFVATTPAVGSSYAIIATWIAGLAALMGGVDAVSGASTTITSAKTGTATNGVAYSYRITTGPDVANTFAATPLPAGLTVNTTSGRITGTPTVSGVFVVHLTASDNGQASRTVTADLTLTIVSLGAPVPVLQSSATPGGPFQDQANATLNAATHTFTAPVTAPTAFYRLRSGSPTEITNLTLNGPSLVVKYK
jgi:hypothetical protein